jgi:pimeloyl-ACP methyl ester carboxylesterase
MRALPILGILLLGAVPALAPSAKAQTTLPIYAGPQQLVGVEGHRLNLVCTGQGAPTVILTAGMGVWSLSWNAVQTPVARKTRVCAWDPAGWGYSEGSSQVQSAANMAADLSALLADARIAPPYVLVGHSGGAYQTMLFADRHRAEVAGMVLVDPSLPDMFQRIGAISPMALKLLRADTANRATTFRRCAADPDHVSAADGAICFHFPAYAGALAGNFTALDHTSLRQATRASLYEQFEANTQAVAEAHPYGDMPLAVLTSQRDPLSSIPTESPASTAALGALWRSAHDTLAGLSTRGTNELVAGSGHQIQLEQPEAVISAIDRIVDAARNGGRR